MQESIRSDSSGYANLTSEVVISKVCTRVRTCGELLLGAVEELQDGGDVVAEPGEGVAAAVAVGEAELAELAEALTELHHGAAVVLQAGRLPVSSNWVIVDGIR